MLQLIFMIMYFVNEPSQIIYSDPDARPFITGPVLLSVLLLQSIFVIIYSVPRLLCAYVGPVLPSFCFTAAVNLHSYLLGAPIFLRVAYIGLVLLCFFAAVNLHNYLFCNQILMSVHL